MSLSRRRVRAMILKELRSYRRNNSLVIGMAIIPIVFLIQPLISVFTIPSSSAVPLSHRHELLYMLAVPALVPATLAAYAVVGERQQGTLEPLLGTPIRRGELLIGKFTAVLLPSILIGYTVFALFVVLVEVFAHAGVAGALIRGPDVVAQLIYTPLIAAASTWIGMGISTRVGDIRVAQQISVLASLPAVAVTTLLSINVIHPSLPVALAFGIGLLIANRLGSRLVAALFDRERLITGTR